MYSAYKLNKQSENIQPWCKPFPIWNHSVVLCIVLTVASWLNVYIPQKSICWSLIPSVLVVGGRTLGRWLGHEGGMILMHDVSSQGLQQKWPQVTIMLTCSLVSSILAFLPSPVLPGITSYSRLSSKDGPNNLSFVGTSSFRNLFHFPSRDGISVPSLEPGWGQGGRVWHILQIEHHRNDAMWLPRLDWKRPWSFCQVLLGHSFLKASCHAMRKPRPHGKAPWRCSGWQAGWFSACVSEGTSRWF